MKSEEDMKHNHGPDEWCERCFKGWMNQEVEFGSKHLSKIHTEMFIRHARKLEKLPMRITEEISPITKGKPPRL